MMQLHKVEQELVDEVMREFDFDICKSTMDYLDWTWGFTGMVPTIQELRQSALNRIENAINGAKNSTNRNHSDAFISSSGGLKASVWRNRYGRICDIQLEFILTEWPTF